MATFVAGDAKYAWDWNWRLVDGTLADAIAGQLKIPAGWELESRTPNDFAFTKIQQAYLNTPLSQRGHWIAPEGIVGAVTRQANYPVKRAFRTAGLVRGKYPYSLVVDDIQKDDSIRHYDWVFLLENDVQVARMDVPNPKTAPKNIQVFDVILSGPTAEKGDPMLLVRLLSRKHTPQVAQPVSGLAHIAMDSTRRLIIPSDSVSPDFRVLLYPFKQGDPLPQTTWNDARDELTLKIRDQLDTIRFKPNADGRSRVMLNRAGAFAIDDVTAGGQ
jgi:hypothetical protein